MIKSDVRDDNNAKILVRETRATCAILLVLLAARSPHATGRHLENIKISQSSFFFFGRYNTGPHGSLNPISLEKVILVLSFLLLYA